MIVYGVAGQGVVSPGCGLGLCVEEWVWLVRSTGEREVKEHGASSGWGTEGGVILVWVGR